MITWEKVLRKTTDSTGDSFEGLITTLTPEEMNKPFDKVCLSNIQGEPITAWGEKYVYFPVQCNKKRGLVRAPRNPCDEATKHW